MAKRRSKTVEQQCRYYEVGNIFEYMVETYLNEPSFYFIYFCIYLKFNIFVAIKIWRSSF